MRAAKNPSLVEQMSRSKIFRDYQRAFGAATGLPLTLRPVESWKMPHRGQVHENEFCEIMSRQSRTCAACLEVQQKLSDTARHEARTVTCFAGLCDTAVPVRLGGELLGFLQTGQVALKKPTRAQFRRTTRQLIDWGLKVDLSELEEAYFHTRVLAPAQYQAMVRLLTIFGQHLATVGNQLAVQESHAEPPAITRARRHIETHQAEPLTLGAVARVANMSSFYFCKMFKQATGLNFTEYVTRVRVEKARNLLLNPHARSSEVAYATGFQSLTHFNRSFRRFTGQSPTQFRAALPRGNAKAQAADVK
jgi:AraC-like DNA-binding protein/ligand-binding sensor protein